MRASKRKLVVVVTGTPGTGKSTFAKELASRLPGSSLVEINDVAKELRLYTGNTWHGSKEVKAAELSKAVKRRIGRAKGPVVVVGHLAPDLGIKCDIAVVLRLGLKELAKRLEARRYHAEKIRENIVSEALDYCGVSMSSLAHEVCEAEGPHELASLLRYIERRAAGAAATPPKLRPHPKSREFLALVRNGNRYGL